MLILATMGLCSCRATTRPVATQSPRDPFLPAHTDETDGVGRASVALGMPPGSRLEEPGVRSVGLSKPDREIEAGLKVAEPSSQSRQGQSATIEPVVAKSPSKPANSSAAQVNAQQQLPEKSVTEEAVAAGRALPSSATPEAPPVASPTKSPQPQSDQKQTTDSEVQQQPGQDSSASPEDAPEKIIENQQSAVRKQERPAVILAEFRAAEPRVQMQHAVHHQGELSANPKDQDRLEHADEYLVDGGDRAMPVHYGQQQRLGLDTEDTVAEFTDDTGQSHVRATNRVAIYAPRFGAVRSISTPRQDTAVARLASATETTRGSKLKNQVVANSHVENQRLDGMRMRARVSGLSNEQTQFKVAQTNRVTEHTKLQNAYLDLAFIGRGVLEQSDEAHMAYGVQAALNWTQDKFPVIHASDIASQSVVARFQAQQHIGVEDEKKVKGDLRIVKIADRRFAEPGDVVTFTIRYDNLGERELREIRIVDNLTPRLAFVDDSATSDRPGNIVIEDNAEGSEVLRFDLDGVLPGKSGGVVTFQTTIR